MQAERLSPDDIQRLIIRADELGSEAQTKALASVKSFLELQCDSLQLLRSFGMDEIARDVQAIDNRLLTPPQGCSLGTVVLPKKMWTSDEFKNHLISKIEELKGYLHVAVAEKQATATNTIVLISSEQGKPELPSAPEDAHDHAHAAPSTVIASKRQTGVAFNVGGRAWSCACHPLDRNCS
jgi:hypothetical protein